jgi:hypothetical protein
MSRNTKVTSSTRAAAPWLVAVGLVCGISGGAMLAPPSASAVIGRPLTPVSFAGVARRTTRRAVRGAAYSGAYSTGAYYPGAVGTMAPVTTTLPAGCMTPSGAVTTCGTTHYQEVYDAGNVVYLEVP